MSIVTLTTDFGDMDYYVPLLKGNILSLDPAVRLIDVTHNISRHDIMEGAFYLASIYRHYPKGTIHLLAVNTFYHENVELLLFDWEGQYFIGPNNGVFSLVFPNHDGKGMVQIPLAPRDDLYHTIGRVVHQVRQGMPLGDIGPNVVSFDRKLTLQAVINQDHIRATIIHVDHFGNVIVNLDRTSFMRVCKDRIYAIYYKSSEPLTKLSHRYSDVPIGDVCAFFNDIDLLEIGINMGNAHELLNLNKNETVQIDFHDPPVPL